MIDYVILDQIKIEEIMKILLLGVSLLGLISCSSENSTSED
jgi:hypothetical protein